MATPLGECARRDPKGLYAAAFAGEIDDFTGVSAPYEEPSDPDDRGNFEGGRDDRGVTRAPPGFGREAEDLRRIQPGGLAGGDVMREDDTGFDRAVGDTRGGSITCEVIEDVLFDIAHIGSARGEVGDR